MAEETNVLRREERGSDWRSIGLRWLLSQGSSTVLLFMVVVFLGHTVYKGFPAVIAYQQHIHEVNAKSYQDVVACFKEEQQRVSKQHEAMLSAVNDLRDAARELRNAAKQQTTVMEKASSQK